jgi:hypothetical protein
MREKGALPKAYLRIDPHLASTHESAGEFIRLLEAAFQQPRRGRFKNIAVLRAAVGRGVADRGVARRDVVGHGSEEDCKREDGTTRDFCSADLPHLYLNGWDEWQEGDHTVGERMRRVRARKRNSTVTPA